MLKATEILETCLCVDDLDAAERFYSQVLGLEFVDRQPGRHVFFRCGRRMFLLFNPAASEQPQGTLPPHGSRGPGHVAFAVTASELEEWRKQLTAAGVVIEAEIDWSGKGRSIYFRDPAGNSVEFAMPEIWGLHGDH